MISRVAQLMQQEQFETHRVPSSRALAPSHFCSRYKEFSVNQTQRNLSNVKSAAVPAIGIIIFVTPSEALVRPSIFDTLQQKV